LRRTSTRRTNPGIVTASIVLGGMLLLLGGPPSLAAQETETVPTSMATEFLGRWTAVLDTGHEIMEAHMDIHDEDGEVRAEVVVADDWTVDRIDRISMSDGAMTLSYFGTGDSVNPYDVTLTREGENLHVRATVANGSMILEGTATPDES
jgi:hypothetical protein